ncbi:MAG: Mur ligase family protein [Candidatus Dormibacteria bacterium]|jgi:UDP-N-acetylmuramoyl-tripeptide--D-alanyl-D-alanine ligase
MTIPVWQALLLTVLAAACAQRRVVGWVYLFQLDEYQPSRIWRTARRRLASNWRWQLALVVGALAMAVVATRPAPLPRVVPLVLAALLVLGTDRPFERRGELRWTSRARELAAVAGVLVLLALFIALWSGWPGALVLGAVDLVAVAALCIAVGLTAPVQGRRRHRYMEQAEHLIERVGPLVIGITGSYGKTTAKLFLQQLLDSEASPCFATPGSFNTTLGVCRAINEGLRPEHKFAVVEMGAYRRGEVAEICAFTHPKMGIITAVGVMHLERFGSPQRIAQAKSELLAALPESGVAAMPSGIAERELLTAALRARPVWVGQPGDRWWAEELDVSPDGSSLRVQGSGGEDLSLRVPVHGMPIVTDLLCAWAIAIEIGVALPDLVERAAQLRGAPHRLQVSRVGGITIIDDAYNANPDGAAEALRLLARLPGRRRVLVTPGFIELGPLQEQSMRELGRRAAEVCTHVILVGPRQSAAVAVGLQEAGYPGAQLTVAKNLDEAQRRLPQVAGEGSVVLFENDLPDSYLEAG